MRHKISRNLPKKSQLQKIEVLFFILVRYKKKSNIKYCHEQTNHGNHAEFDVGKLRAIYQSE